MRRYEVLLLTGFATLLMLPSRGCKEKTAY